MVSKAQSTFTEQLKSDHHPTEGDEQNMSPKKRSDPLKVSLITSLYRCEKDLKRYFSTLLNLTNLQEIEVILVHNDPLDSELDIIHHFRNKNPEVLLQHITVPRETVYASWNRAIRISSANYLAIWNVDDIRFPDSLRIQASLLDTHPSHALVFGSKWLQTSRNPDSITPSPRRWVHRLGKTIRFQDGSFIMWRKSVHNHIGYFDEQFLSSGDQEFWYRVNRAFPILLAPLPLGLYREIPGVGISKTQENQMIRQFEKMVLTYRYGLCTSLNLPWKKLGAGGSICKEKILSFREEHTFQHQLFYKLQLSVTTLLSLITPVLHRGREFNTSEAIRDYQNLIRSELF